MLVFTAGVAVLTGMLFGLAPALRSVDLDPGTALKEGSRTAGDPRGHRIRAALVSAEVALSLVLLIGAGLMLKSMQGLLRVDAGFDSAGVLTAQLSVPKQKYVDEALERRFSTLAYAKATRFFSDVIERTRSVPGVEAAGAINALPLMGEVWNKVGDAARPSVAGDASGAAGDPVPGGGRRLLQRPGHLDPLRPRLHGRGHGARVEGGDRQPRDDPAALEGPEPGRQGDRGESANPLVPAGTVPPDYNPTLFTIFGVATDVHYGALNAPPAPLVYVPYAQGSEGATTMYLVVRASGDPTSLVPAIREGIRQVDPDVPASSIRTMSDRVATSVARPRLHSIVLGAFAGLALLLAAVGIYGVISDAAQRRTREIGIRMAMGASSSAILGLFLRQTLAMVLVGLMAGLSGALALTRAMRALLFEVSPTDPLVFAGITLVLATVALVAAWVPARRATRLDPLVALRED